MTIDGQQISATLVRLADTLVSDYDILDYLDELLTHSTAALSASAGGVMLFNARAATPGLELLSCSDERARVLELFELQHAEGPCVDSHRLGLPVLEVDLATSQRWPGFTTVALDRGFRSVYAFPMRLRGTVVGALNLFRNEPGAVDIRAARAAQAFADMATIGILQQRAVQEARDIAAQLQTALNSRVVVEQAKGIVSERLHYDMEQAYQAMRGYARDRNLQLRRVAGSIVAGTLQAEGLLEPFRPNP